VHQFYLGQRINGIVDVLLGTQQCPHFEQPGLQQRPENEIVVISVARAVDSTFISLVSHMDSGCRGRNETPLARVE
jgi:hypothetical protein